MILAILAVACLLTQPSPLGMCAAGPSEGQPPKPEQAPSSYG